MKPHLAARLVIVLSGLCAAVLLNVLGAGAPPAPAAPAPVPPYGSLTGRFVLAGLPPPRALIHKKGAPVRDAVCCAKEDLFSEELVVDPRTGGLANVCVFLSRASAIHPKFARDKGKLLRQDVVGCRFVPHVLVARIGQRVRVTKSDPCAHALRVEIGTGLSLALLLPAAGYEVEVKAPGPEGRVPIGVVSCFLHPWMRSWWLILDHPYAAVTDADGKFALADLPAGTHQLRVWHEKSGWINRALPVTVRRGQTIDLGTIPVPLARFIER